MDLKLFCDELRKIKSVNTILQGRLGELTLMLNSKNVNNISQDVVLDLINLTQNFLCHKFFSEYNFVKSKTNSNLDDQFEMQNNLSIYDNCMSLILVISARLSKFNNKYTKRIIENFLEHIATHFDCFNYIISFYRLYLASDQLRFACKEINLHNYLFELYSKIYKVCSSLEGSEFKIKNLNSLMKIGIKNQYDKNLFLEDYRMKFEEEDKKLNEDLPKSIAMNAHFSETYASNTRNRNPNIKNDNGLTQRFSLCNFFIFLILKF